MRLTSTDSVPQLGSSIVGLLSADIRDDSATAVGSLIAWAAIAALKCASLHDATTTSSCTANQHCSSCNDTSNAPFAPAPLPESCCGAAGAIATRIAGLGQLMDRLQTPTPAGQDHLHERFQQQIYSPVSGSHSVSEALAPYLCIQSPTSHRHMLL